MTDLEAVKELKKHSCYECAVGSESPTKCEWDCKYKDAYTMAINSLEKQIPKKVNKQAWIDTKCECGHVFSKSYPDGYYTIPYENMTKYCPDCGQRLDWEV